MSQPLPAWLSLASSPRLHNIFHMATGCPCCGSASPVSFWIGMGARGRWGGRSKKKSKERGITARERGPAPIDRTISAFAFRSPAHRSVCLHARRQAAYPPLLPPPFSLFSLFPFRSDSSSLSYSLTLPPSKRRSTSAPPVPSRPGRSAPRRRPSPATSARASRRPRRRRARRAAAPPRAAPPPPPRPLPRAPPPPPPTPTGATPSSACAALPTPTPCSSPTPRRSISPPGSGGPGREGRGAPPRTARAAAPRRRCCSASRSRTASTATAS